MKIGYYSPSYKRKGIVRTKELFPFVNIVVAESEKEEYNGVEVITCPDEVQGNLCRVRNWILDNYLDKYDAIVLLDDDYKGVFRWENVKKKRSNGDEFQELCEQIAIVCKEYGLFFFGLNCITDKGSYREHTPFSINAYIGGPFQGFIKGNKLRYDEELNLKEDYDMTLQNLNVYRGALRANFACYEVLQAEQVGGCASQRNLDEEKRQFELLQKKYGSKIIKRDRSSRRSFDFNPIMKSPLRGV